jgi:hypothetical protein
MQGEEIHYFQVDAHSVQHVAPSFAIHIEHVALAPFGLSLQKMGFVFLGPMKGISLSFLKSNK